MICTNAFSTGNDYEHVRLIVHMKMALEMSELIQAQGRAGRDGRTAKCIIVPATTGSEPKISKEEVDHKGLWAAYEHAYKYGDGQCLRYGMTLYVDGQGVECKEDNVNVPCSACKKKKQGAGETRKRGIEEISGGGEDQFAEAAYKAKKQRAARQEGELKEVEWMRKALNVIKEMGCGACAVTGKKMKHGPWNCKVLESYCMTFNQYSEWKTGVRYGKGHKGICWKCHVPSCEDALHGPFGNGRKCEWEDVVMPTIMGIYLDVNLKSRAETAFGCRWMNTEELMKWLMKMPEKGKHSKGMDLYMWFVETQM